MRNIISSPMILGHSTIPRDGLEPPVFDSQVKSHGFPESRNKSYGPFSVERMSFVVILFFLTSYLFQR